MDFLTTLITVGIMIALAVPGFILRKAKMLPDGAVATLVCVLMYVAQPVMVVDGFLAKTYEPELLLNMGIAFVSALVVHIVMFFIIKLIFIPFKPKSSDDEAKIKATNDKNNVCIICSFLGNAGFMGLPVMKALFPEHPEILMYTTMVIVAFNLICWTVGIFVITGDKKNIGLKRIFLNPPTVAAFIGIIVFFIKGFVAIPEDLMINIERFTGYLGDMTLPLSMMVLGVRLADIKFLDLFNDGKVYLTCANKLILCPLVTFCLLLLVRLIYPALDYYLFAALFIVLAMPSASSCLSFAEMFDSDREVAVKITLLSTILSVLTIPVIMLLCSFI